MGRRREFATVEYATLPVREPLLTNAVIFVTVTVSWRNWVGSWRTSPAGDFRYISVIALLGFGLTALNR
jgi:hypothetical protein